MHPLQHYLAGLRGRYVEVDRGSPEFCQGWLAVTADDYLTLLSVTGDLLHRPLHHIHSIAMTPPPPDHAPVSLEVAPEPASFTKLLAQHVGQAVRLNHAGPAMEWGILRTVLEDHLLLELESGETVCYQLFHIRSWSLQTEAPAAPAADETNQSRQGR